MLVTQGRQVQFITSRIERLIVMTGTPQKSSANKNGPSLNEFLKAGPCLLPKILDILVRFRAYKYGLTSDIKAAFLNIRDVEEDRDFLRFLWISNFMENESELLWSVLLRLCLAWIARHFYLEQQSKITCRNILTEILILRLFVIFYEIYIWMIASVVLKKKITF